MFEIRPIDIYFVVLSLCAVAGTMCTALIVSLTSIFLAKSAKVEVKDMLGCYSTIAAALITGLCSIGGAIANWLIINFTAAGAGGIPLFPTVLVMMVMFLVALITTYVILKRVGKS